MKIIFTGITGFIGKDLAVELFKRGHEIVALARNPNRVREKLAIPMKSYFWDGTKNLPPAEAMRNADLVINLAGEPIVGKRWNEAYKRALYESRVLTTRNLARGVKAHCSNTCKLVLSASAIGFYGDRGEEILDETSAAGRGFLSELCTSWEKELEEELPKAVGHRSLRIGLVLGRDGGALEKMLPPFMLGLGGPIGSGNQWVSWIHKADLIAMILWCIEKSKGSGPVNATAPQPVRNSVFSGALAKALGKPAACHIPKSVLKIAMGEGSRVLLDSQRVLPTAVMNEGFVFKFPDIESALQDIANPEGHKEASQKVYVHFLPKELDQPFPFFSNERNLEKITPPALSFRVLRKSADTIGNGTLIDYALKVRGIPFRWKSEIVRWTPPQEFTDCQVRGPYQLWEHQHQFEKLSNGTLMTDKITYRLPLGAIGSLFGKTLVAKDIDSIFAYRRKAIDRLFNNHS